VHTSILATEVTACTVDGSTSNFMGGLGTRRGEKKKKEKEGVGPGIPNSVFLECLLTIKTFFVINEEGSRHSPLHSVKSSIITPFI
jgi:hypothetical protein